MSSAEPTDNQGSDGKQMSLFLAPVVGTTAARKSQAKVRGARRPPVRECSGCGRRVGSFKEYVMCKACIRKDRIRRGLDPRIEAIWERAKVNVFPEGY